MGRTLTPVCLAAVALLLGCTSTAPCDCPPKRTSAIVYGEVRTAAGDPAAAAVVRFLLAPPTGTPSAGDRCDFDPPTSDAEPEEVRADAAGRFRAEVFSTFGAPMRCLRVTAVAGVGAATGGVDGLLVPFKFSQPDSVGIVLTLR